MSTLDAPNQQVVRADGSAPWEEGEGGAAADAPAPEPSPLDAGDPGDLDQMTLAQLRVLAGDRGLSSEGTKAELQERLG